jgi:hypothetical protein
VAVNDLVSFHCWLQSIFTTHNEGKEQKNTASALWTQDCLFAKRKIMEPREFTDPNVRFWLFNGIEEELKVTEPSLNYPLAENCRFVAEVDERSVVDVRFEFNPARDRPYELHFNIRDGFDYQGAEGEAKVETYGSQGDEDLLEEHYVRIFEHGNTVVDIGLTRGKARVYIETERE